MKDSMITYHAIMKSYKMMYHIRSLFLIFKHSDVKEEDSLSNNAEL